MRPRYLSSQAGATLVEVLVALGLLAIMLPTLSLAVITANYAQPEIAQHVKAASLAEAAATAVRSVRDAGWSNIATDGTYHPVISSGQWTLASSSESVNGFVRQIIISSVSRNASGNIVSSGGTVDADTKKITVSVAWDEPAASSITRSFYLTNWQNGSSTLSWTQTTQADFAADTLSNITVTNTSGGEAQLTTTNGPTDGTIESTTFDAGQAVTFGSLSFTATAPTGTNLQFQIATNNDNATWNYVGPDGTSGSYFTTSPGTIPATAASGRYIRYKALLTAGRNSSPVLDDVTINYSK